MKAYVVLLIAVVIGAAVLFLQLRHPQNRSMESKPLLTSVHFEDVMSIEVQSPKDGVRLNKLPDAMWQAEPIEADTKNAPPTTPVVADREKVQKALDVLKNLRAGPAVSRNPEHYAEFELGPSATIVRLFGKEHHLLKQMSVGKMTPDFSGNYLRVEEVPEVFTSPKSLSLQFSTNVQDWKQTDSSPETKP